MRVVAAHGADGTVNAVFADLRDVEAARLVAVLVALTVDVEAGGGFQGIFQGGEAAIIHLLAGDDTDGLRGILDGKVEAGGGGCRGDGVAVGHIPVDGDGREGVTLLCLCLRGDEQGSGEGCMAMKAHGDSPILRVWINEYEK